MPVFVSDTATLMTLELCQLLETMLTGGITIVIPDLAYKRDFEGGYFCPSPRKGKN